MENYSAINIEIISYEGKEKLETITASDISLSQKLTHYMTSHVRENQNIIIKYLIKMRERSQKITGQISGDGRRRRVGGSRKRREGK